MLGAHPIDELFAISRKFGPRTAKEKLQQLKKIASIKAHSARRIALLQDTLYFMLAYPDSAEVLQAVQAVITNLPEMAANHAGGDPQHYALLNTGIPGSCNSYAYSYAVLQRLVDLCPGCLEFDWEEITDESALVDALLLVVEPAEVRGLEDECISLQEWLQQCRTAKAKTDLEVVLQLFRESLLNPYQQMHVFETCDLPILYHLRNPASARCEVKLPVKRIIYQRQPIARESFPLKPKIVKPLIKHQRLSAEAGRRMIDASLSALCSRNLEIYPLIYAMPEDVSVVDCGRGLQVVLAGMLPEFRSSLESLFFFMILKNGVPLAYGPASVFLGCCEMGINLFPEFRGGEIRYIYSQFMRVLYHLAQVRYFFLTSYGMGEDNLEALRSGAFWFYRRLGFKVCNPKVEALARVEEQIMAKKPGYRSSISTLRKLSHTEAYFDLSGGTCRPVDFGRLGMAVSRLIRDRFAGNRQKAKRAIARQMVEFLSIENYHSWKAAEKNAMDHLAPFFMLISGIRHWSALDKRSLAELIKAKGASSELTYVQRLSEFPRLDELREQINRL